MIRTQIQLRKEQAEALKELALKEGRSLADLVRESVNDLLRQRRVPQLSIEQRLARAESAFGKIRSETGDLSLRHDEIFAEAAGEWNSSSTPRR